MSISLYLVEKRNECGDLEKPLLLTEDELLNFAKDIDENIEISTLSDALENTYGYQISEIQTMYDVKDLFDNIISDYTNYKE